MAYMQGKKLFVVGGTGYIGKRVVAAAAHRGYDVIALSRNAPVLSRDPKVKYIRGDATEPKDYADALKSCQAAVYCTGELVGWQENLAIRSLMQLKGYLTKTPTVETRRKLYDNSFQKKNYDGALAVGKQLAAFGSPAEHRQFAYISAGYNPFFYFASPDYFRYKWQAEEDLNGLKNLDSVSVRPGIVTAKEDAFRTAAGILGQPVAGRTDMDTLVQFILDSLVTPQRYGKVFDVDQIRAKPTA